jgi:hypothetical protein
MVSIYSTNQGAKVVFEMGNRKAIQANGAFTEYFVRDNAESEWRSAYAVFADAFIAKVKAEVR